jgi:hypothetical protein
MGKKGTLALRSPHAANTQRRQFRDDLKRQKRRGKDTEELIAAVELLAENGTLPEGYRPHKLSDECIGDGASGAVAPARSKS